SVAVNAPGAGTATGWVTFLDGSTPVATVALAGGHAGYQAALAVGSHTITAVYNGNSSFNPSISNNAIAPVRAADTTTALSDGGATVFGQAASLTANVAPIGVGAPTGSVEFF